MPPSRRPAGRVLIHSHDTYGLGHIRRSLLLAEHIAALPAVDAVLVTTGSPRAQSFSLPPGVDTLKLPAATKAPGGEYATRTLGVPFDDLVELRAGLIDAAVESFGPDLVLVDHAPVGMAGELRPLLRRLSRAAQRPSLVLGLRDIVDQADRVAEEWDRLDAWPFLDRLYDRVLVYGDGAVPTTAQELDLGGRLAGAVRHVGYLGRTLDTPAGEPDDRPTVVVTVGGGGDGLPLLQAYADHLGSLASPPPYRSVVITGPFLSDRRQTEVRERLTATGADVEIHEFVERPEHLVAAAAAVIAMGGYNSTCEILAAGVPALLVPRQAPRAEQWLRAQRLAAVGAVATASLDELPSRLAPFLDAAVAGTTPPAATLDLGGLARAAVEIDELLGRPMDRPAGVLTTVPPSRSRQVAPSIPGATCREPEEGNAPGGPRVGYVLKKFPRLSETFILNELLALEGAGADITVLATRPADDEPRHAALRHLAAPIHQLHRHRSGTLPALLAELHATSGTEVATTVERFLQRLPERARADVLGQGLEVAGEVADRGLDHLHAHFMTVAAHVAYVAHLVIGVPFSVTAHAKDIYRHTVDPELFAEVAGAARAVVTVCEANRRFIVDHLLGRSPATVEVIYNGVSIDTTGARGDRRPDLVLAVGRLVEKKGFDVLVDACRALRDAGRPVRCLIVGQGEQQAALEARIASAGLGERVTLAGALPSEDVLDLMRHARLLAAPCVTGADGNRDALPTVVLEAMACGLPVVATPVGGIEEMVEHESEGLIVPEGDAGALATAIDTLLTDDARWQAMTDAGPRRVAERFDRRVAAARLAALFGTTGTTGSTGNTGTTGTTGTAAAAEAAAVAEAAGHAGTSEPAAGTRIHRTVRPPVPAPAEDGAEDGSRTVARRPLRVR